MKNFYITTPIYYVTAKPHLGSLYSTLIADVLARYQKLCGREAYLLTGTDEHGQKIAQAAAQAGLSPQEFVDSFIPSYINCWRQYGIEYNQFLRTTDAVHVQRAQQFVTHVQQSGFIYKAAYEGWYCTPCESFITEKDIPNEGVPICPSCGRHVVWVSEDTYYFKLSAFQDRLLKFYDENPDFIMPKERFNEVIRFVESGLKDLSISRTTVPWGVPFPRDEKHTIYVWVEALSNYITAVGYGDRAAHYQFQECWPADIQVLGKDIVRFHAVYWPALLMAAGLPLPKKLLVHGWITVDHQKMSKSLGNVVDPLALHATYGADPVRYYLMKHIPITHDGNFSIMDLEQTISADLANTLGNLFNRASVLAQTVCQGRVTVPQVFSPDAQKVLDAQEVCIAEYKAHMDHGFLHLALAAIQTYLHTLNQYFHATAPWKRAKTDQNGAIEILAVIARGLHAAALLLWPIMPSVMIQLLQALGIDAHATQALNFSTLENMQTTYAYAVIPSLFAKYETIAVEKTMEKTVETKVVTQANTIGIEDFLKVQLAVGTITTALAVEKSDKLIKLSVDFGAHGTRQILSGLRLHHQPETLVGMQAVFVLNLKPRMMLGLESYGMLLTAQDAQGVPQPVKPIVAVVNGTVLK